MKAVVYERYGSFDNLELREAKKPKPKDNEVLIKIQATSINASDMENLAGSPLYIRMWGLFKPKNTILGSDIAGIVEKIGKDITTFQPGDAVFADVLYHRGGFAEYVCLPEKELTLKPDNLSFIEAAALPQSASIALQGLQYKEQVKSGQTVLINGAGGGAGSFAIQLAKFFGATVTAVDNTEKLEMMCSIGADHVIDYTKEDFTQNGQVYDQILDFVASHSIFDYKRALSSKGTYAMVGGHMRHIFQTLSIGPVISMITAKKMGLVTATPNKDLNYIIELVESDKIKPVIDKVFPLHQVPEAFHYFSEGHVKGKLVITM